MASDQPLSWSTSLRVVHPSRVASKDLHGDKIVLPQSALEQLLAASTTTGPSTTHTFTAFDPFNPYSVADARRERSQYRETYQQLPHPLMFQLVNPQNGNTVYTGIREFSAAEGDVALSPYLLDALGIQEKELQDPVLEEEENEDGDKAGAKGVHITVKAKQLPKGTYVRLRPLEAGYNPDDWKALLERQLRGNFTTLTKDSMLSVRGAKGEEFRFLADKFLPEGDGICVVDTDLEVDIEPLNEEQARETLRQISAKAQRAPGTEAGSSVGHAIDIWKDVDGRVHEGDYVDYELPSWDKARAIAIELTIHDGLEVDLFVSPKSNRQRALPRDDEHVFGDFSSPKDGVKRIVISPTNVELENAESLLISVHGFSLPGSDPSGTKSCRYTLRARAAEPEASATNPADLTGPQPTADEEQCKNCLQIVPKRTMILHENFCLRNNILCPHCHDVFQKRSPEWQHHWHCPSHPDAHGSTPHSKLKHDHVHHTPHPCLPCSSSSSSTTNAHTYPSQFTFPTLPALSHHRTTTCPAKLHLCQFCHLEVPQEGDPTDPASEAETVLTGLTAHERADGARTTDCHLCGAIVRLRDMAAHAAHHEMDKVSRAKPRLCRDGLCGRTRDGVGPGGRLKSGNGLGGGVGGSAGQGAGNELGLCSLCFAPLYVSMHDPEGKALRRRIERRYLAQLMSGCGRGWCVNEWCRTGRAKLGLEPLGTGAAAALPLVKPLLEEVKDHEKEMHFCVDEASQRRRKTAEMLAAEGVWELEWCVAALEAEGGSLERARGWLADWAPTKVAGGR